MLGDFKINLALGCADFGDRGGRRLLEGLVIQPIGVERILDKLVDRELRRRADIDGRSIFKNQVHPRVRAGDDLGALPDKNPFFHGGLHPGRLDHLGGVPFDFDDTNVADHHFRRKERMRECKNRHNNQLKYPGVHKFSGKLDALNLAGKGKFPAMLVHPRIPRRFSGLF